LLQRVVDETINNKHAKLSTAVKYKRTMGVDEPTVTKTSTQVENRPTSAVTVEVTAGLTDSWPESSYHEPTVTRATMQNTMMTKLLMRVR
jgi:hypothetical protein